MNELDCPGDKQPQGNGKSFKGVENFLKRVAFNLGNTPSRTEVKIISCIPIDVSDLQQKIIYLEKQLEEAKLGDDPKNPSTQKRVVNTVIYENKYPHVSHTGVSCNALEMDRGTNPYDGNMSAKKKSNVSFVIPSDHGSNVNASSSHRYEMHYTDDDKRYAEFMGQENDMKPFIVGDVKQRQGRKNLFKKKKKAFSQKKNKNHYVYYAQTNSNPFNKSEAADEVSRINRAKARSYIAKVMDKQYKPQIFGRNLSDISTFSSPICRDTLDYNVGYSYESDICSCCHGAYHNIDNQPLLYDTQQIYRAHNITRGGFYDSTFYDVVPVKEKPVKVKKTIDMPKKREAKPSVDIMCWPEDVRSKLRTYPIYNPLYLDYTAVLPRTDNYLRKVPKINNREPIVNNVARNRNNIGKPINMEMSKSSCIDFGDVYPKFVKKRIDRVDRCIHVDKYLTATQTPRKVDAECLAIVTNNSECQTVSSVLDTKDSIQSSDDKTEETLNQIKTILQSVLHEVKVSSMSKSTADEKPKKDATVQKGVSQGNMPGPIQINMAGPLQDNIGRPVQANLSRFLHGDVLRAPDLLPGINHSNIAESLQTNLPGNLQGSRLLNSFTYSPYDINPYLPSCSKQMNPNQYYYSQSPLKCYQNFPLIVQNQGRPTCGSCFRNSAHMKSYYGRQAATIATNTETVKAEHSKETEKLIKEIYKSMALTMGAVKKENSSDYEPLRDFSNHVEKSTKTVIEKPTPVKEFKKVTNVVQAVSELFRKRDMQFSSDSHNLTESQYESHRDPTESRYDSHNTNTATESKQMSTDATTLSQSPTTNTELDIKRRKERVDKFLGQSKRKLSEGTHQDKRKIYTETQNMKPAVELSETSSSESETDDTFVPTPTKQVIQKERKEKKGLFSKMFRSVKFLKPKERKKREKKETKAETPTEESSTDSDDYQTIYSQKIEVAPKHRPKVYNLSKRRTHSKISYRHLYQRDKSPEKFIRRSPYMEQEYRRHWNEKLMFHDNKYQKHSSEHPYSQRYPGEAARRVNPYYQTYEARTAIIEPKIVPKNDGMFAKRVVLPHQTKNQSNKMGQRIASNAVPWLKKHKLGNIRCGEHFRQLINEN